MDKNLNKMDGNLKKSEFIVRGMSSTFGFIRNIFSSNKQAPPKEEKKKEEPVSDPIQI